MHHIALTTDVNNTWCGERLSNEYHFENAEMAALNGLYDGDVTVCPQCVDYVVICLQKKRGNLNESNKNTPVGA